MVDTTYFRFDYAIRNPEGEVVDTSEGGTPMSFVQGDGTMIAGLEKALANRVAGDEFEVTIAPEDAYGHPQRALVRTLSAEQFDRDVEQGMVFQMGSGPDHSVVRVVEVDGDAVTVDGNHPLAGITFHFDITVLEARPATPEELAFQKRH